MGNICSNNQLTKEFKLDIEDIKRHILIYGQTGSGKTWFLKNFLYSFNKQYNDIPFIIFDFKGEYRSLKKVIPELEIIKPGTNFFIDIFNNDIFKKDIFGEVLFNSLQSCQIMDDNRDYSPQMEQVLIDVLNSICKKDHGHSWENLFHILDQYELKNQNKIPLINQTIISIKNRLRRYNSGPLKTLFMQNSNKKLETNTLSEILDKKCVIELGNILKLGGSKEDVLFWANLILKWIWEKNMQNNATSSLRHLTVFEDLTYIASKKIIELSNLSTYLEDIALLLRGKGEALITLTTTLNISENILLNSGSKFFFKFNDDSEKVIPYLSLNKYSEIDFKEMQTGYCLAKIDSIPNTFLLKSSILDINKIKKTKQLKEKSKMIKSRKENAIIPLNNNNISAYNVEKSNIDSHKKNNKNNIIDELKNAEESFLMEDYEKCWNILYSIWKLIKKSNLQLTPSVSSFYLKTEQIFLIDKEKILENPEKLLYVMKSIQRLKDIFDNTPNSNENIKILSNNLPSLNKEEKICTSKINPNTNLSNIKFTVVFNFFNVINGPEEFFEQGNNSKDIDNKIREDLLSFLERTIGDFTIERENYIIYYCNFEIPSKWARGKKELLQIAVFFNSSQNLDDIILNIKPIIKNFIRFCISDSDLYKAFYLTNRERIMIYKNSIVGKNRFLKEKVKDLSIDIEKQTYYLGRNNKLKSYTKKEELNEIEFREFEIFVQNLIYKYDN